MFTDQDSRVTYEKLLQFPRADDQIPILGFDKLATLDFYTSVENVRRLVHASACDIQLFLAQDADVERLSSMLEQSVCDSTVIGFI